jgi:hypothetical protein
MFGGQFGWDSEAGESPEAGEEDASDTSSLAGPEYSGSSRLGFLYTLVTCVDQNPRLIGEFRNVRIG